MSWCYCLCFGCVLGDGVHVLLVLKLSGCPLRLSLMGTKGSRRGMSGLLSELRRLSVLSLLSLTILLLLLSKTVVTASFHACRYCCHYNLNLASVVVTVLMSFVLLVRKCLSDLGP